MLLRRLLHCLSQSPPHQLIIDDHVHEFRTKVVHVETWNGYMLDSCQSVKNHQENHDGENSFRMECDSEGTKLSR